MDNAPIHTSDSVTGLIEIRGYRAIYLPSYSPGLNPVENFWSIVKNSVKRSEFTKTEDLKTRIVEASESVSRKALYNIANVPTFKLKKKEKDARYMTNKKKSHQKNT